MKSPESCPWLAGVVPDLPSPFDADDRIDVAAFETLCQSQIAAGVTALLVGETAGETATLSMDEHNTLVRAAVHTSQGRVKVIAGIGSNDTSKAIALARRSQMSGADAVMPVVPYYNKPSQAGIEAHFRAIADATALPVILHDNPASCVVGLTDETLLKLCGQPRIIGHRDSSGDANRPLKLRDRLPAGFKLLSGDDKTALAFLAYGGDGLVSTVANVVPALPVEIFEAFSKRDLARAAMLAARLSPLSDAFARDGAAAALKYALALRGLCSPRVRLPIVPLQSQQKAAVTEATAAALGGQHRPFSPAR